MTVLPPGAHAGEPDEIAYSALTAPTSAARSCAICTVNEIGRTPRRAGQCRRAACGGRTLAEAAAGLLPPAAWAEQPAGRHPEQDRPQPRLHPDRRRGHRLACHVGQWRRRGQAISTAITVNGRCRELASTSAFQRPPSPSIRALALAMSSGCQRPGRDSRVGPYRRRRQLQAQGAGDHPQPDLGAPTSRDHHGASTAPRAGAIGTIWPAQDVSPRPSYHAGVVVTLSPNTTLKLRRRASSRSSPSTTRILVRFPATSTFTVTATSRAATTVSTSPAGQVRKARPRPASCAGRSTAADRGLPGDSSRSPPGCTTRTPDRC